MPLNKFQERLKVDSQALINLFSSATSAKVELMQKSGLLEVLTYASNNSQWWRDFFGELKFKPDNSLAEILATLPISTRVTLQDNFQAMQIFNENFGVESLATFSTTGSTGQPVKVVKHKGMHMINYNTITIADWLLHGLDPKGKVIFMKYGQPEIDNMLLKPFDIFGAQHNSLRRDPSMHTPSEILDIVENYRPRYLLGTVAPMRAAAREAKLQNRNMRGIIDQFVTHADPVTQNDREIIRDVFGCEISNRYSTEEVGYVAIQCPHEEHLHVVAPYMIVEILNKQLEPCAPGESGEVYLTALKNFTMPIIRYAIGDYAIPGDKCTHSNWPTIESIVGRTRESLIDENGNEFIPVLGNLSALKNAPILEFQSFLFTDAIAFVYRAPAPLPTEVEEELGKKLQERLRTKVPVKFLKTERVSWRSEYKKKTFEKLDESIDAYPDGDSILSRETR